MRSFSYILVALLLAVVAIEGHAGFFDKSPSPVNHIGQSDCATCHLSGAGVKAENAHLLVSTQKELCSKCHEKSVRLSHPSGFATKAVAPLVYPLNWKGELVCSTCHMIHAPIGKMLRGDRRGKDFCLTCHTPKFFRDLASKGVRVALSEHVSASPDLLQHEIDPGSIVCLYCHSGAKSKSVVYVDPALIAYHGPDSAYTHPVGRPYRKNPALGLRLNDRPNSSVQLIQGQLTCLSCHKNDSVPHGQLLLPIKNQELCRECHDFKK